MSKYRAQLPQLEGGMFLTDGGLETTLVFHDGIDLPHFAAFGLMRDPKGVNRLRRHFDDYCPIARDAGRGFVLEAPTWRASSDWGDRMGYSTEALDAVNKEAIELLEEVRAKYETDETPYVISGCMAPRYDAYNPEHFDTADEAEAYHSVQIASFKDTAVDMVSALTMTNIEEAIGLVRAAKAAGIPSVISFTVETDGRIPAGQPLGEAIEAVDDATDGGPAYYMINCAHPTHFEDELAGGGAWVSRIRALRANASRCSHAELDNAEVLDEGDPYELGGQYKDLLAKHSHINVLGGCCGTDHRHVKMISDACK